MSAWINLLRGGLLFDTATFEALRERRDAMLRGAIVIIVIALVAGIPGFISDLVNGIQAHPLSEAEASASVASVEQWLSTVAPNVSDTSLNLMRRSTEIAVQVAREISALPTLLPKPVSGVLSALGGWLSRPFSGGLPLAAASLATWLGYGVWVLLAAKLLGGRAEVREFFGATSLFAAPHVLNILNPVPYLGAVVGFIAYIWGFAIYVKATAVSNEFSIGRALVAAWLPIIVAILLIFFGLLALILWLAASGGGQ
jgi:hypothetical protein